MGAFADQFSSLPENNPFASPIPASSARLGIFLKNDKVSIHSADRKQKLKMHMQVSNVILIDGISLKIRVPVAAMDCPREPLTILRDRNHPKDEAMIVKRLILKKILKAGYVAEFNLVKREGTYEACLYLNGKHVGGPPLPCLLTEPKEDLTHWMGNRPTVGLTESEAERIIAEVEAENAVLKHRQKSGWDE